jgi:hypothetical protein
MFAPTNAIAKKRISIKYEKRKRERLQKFTEEFVFKKVFNEEYWGKAFQNHVENPTDVDEHTPFSDFFSLGIGKSGITAICLVPQIRCAWDMLIALYHLYFPSKFPSTQYVAKLLHTHISSLFTELQEVENFDAEAQLKYLRGMFDDSVILEGGNFNWYLTDPLACAWAFSRSFILITQGKQGMETDEELEPKMVEKLKELYEQHKEAAITHKVFLGKLVEKELEKSGLFKEKK